MINELFRKRDRTVDGLQAFYLADWHVDPGTLRLRRDGQEIKLESKMMAVLHYLARHPGELITREALEQAIWGKTIVGYDALTGCVAKLRKVLGDDPHQPRYIETIAKKGYRLIGDVSTEAIASQIPATARTDRFVRQRLLWGAGSGFLIAAMIVIAVFIQPDTRKRAAAQAQTNDRPSIAVLPFANLGNEAGYDYFSNGITADVTTALSKLSGLFVISQSSTGNWRTTPVDMREAATALGVRYLVEGNIRSEGNRLRINAHLVDADSNIYLWSAQYDRELQNIFDVQDDITANIINALSVTLTEAETRRTAQRYTTSIAAYDDFLRGQALYIQHTREDNLLARSYFQQAIDRDAAFARAFSAMALTYVADYRYGWAEPPPDQLDLALRLAEKGIELDNELPQAYWVLGYVRLFRQEYQKAAKAAGRAIDLEPNFADGYLTLAVCKLHFGSAAEALQLVRKAMLLNPKYPAAYASILGQVYYVMGEYEQAVPVLREATERNINLLTSHVFLIAALSKLERPGEAAWAATQLKTIASDFNVNTIGGMLPVQNAAIITDMQKHLRQAGL